MRVHCHIGSLEIMDFLDEFHQAVHCHIGSLENILGSVDPHLFVHCHIGSLEKYGANILQRYLVHCHVKKHRFQPNSLRALLVARVYFSFNQLNQISILLRCFKWYSSVLDKRATCMFYDERSSISWFFHFDFSSELIYLRSACSQRTISLSFSSKR